MNWEQAVAQLRNKPEFTQAVLDNYFEADIQASADRFLASEEFNSLMKLVPDNAKNVLDIGAGRGIVTYAFAKSNLQTYALEPDPSNDVGAGAINYLSTQNNLGIQVAETFGEQLPYADNFFDVVYVRQVLHHANDLGKFCKEVQRVLKPGGTFIATREHVLSNDSDLLVFLDNHLLHKLYGGEHAYTLPHYISCIEQADLHIKQIINPYQSVINFAPTSMQQMKTNFINTLSKIMGESFAKILVSNSTFYDLMCLVKGKSDKSPGRLYSFVAIK